MSGDETDGEETLSIERGPVLEAMRQLRKPFSLQQVQGPGAPQSFQLLLPEVVIGRSLQAHISLDSGSLSRRHVTLTRKGLEYVCSDLGSKNGFYVNGVRAHSAVLRDGDTLQLGEVVFLYREGDT
ncbi:MAG: FHA domain-containing protein [Polyangiaceae bacterium]